MKSTILAVLLIIVAVVAQDHCNAYLTCEQCVVEAFCGWCSTPVVYQNGQKGYNCAGFNKNSSEPFICNGIYSTGTCIEGYVCNITTYQCDLTIPGGGQPLSVCQANCTTTGKTFICNNTTMTCEVAPAGQGTSLELCEAECVASHSPASNSPASSSPASNSPASGSPGSSSPSSHSPAPTTAPTYLCNSTSLQCYVATPGHGTSLQLCQQICTKHNNTPTDLLGLWRGFPISKGQSVIEADLNFTTDNTVMIHTPQFDSVCDVVSVGNDVWFTNCVAPEPPLLKCLWEMTLTLPETYHAMIACNFAGGDAPATFDQAMQFGTDGNFSVFFFSKCVPDGFCEFHFGNSSVHSHATLINSLRHRLKKSVPSLSFTDPCSAFGANCSYCLTQEYCGWCSTNVVYTDGSVGNQCAGFNPDPTKKSPFTCTGTYSTEMCYPGWICIPENQTCVHTIPGSGEPLAECEISCKSKPGPPSILIGDWRGLQINNEYTYGVFEVTINSTGIVATLSGQHVFSGTMTHLAGDVFITFTDGPAKGATIGGIYSNQQNELVEYIEIAFGPANGAVPENYKVAMKPPSMEFVLAKCASQYCQF